MTTHLVTFSDASMSRARNLCADSACGFGVTDAARYNESLLVERSDWKSEWSQQRGYGYWRWKPMIIQSNLEGSKDGDILIYADAGVEFINNVNYIIDRMDQDMFLFGNNWEHLHWCKRSVIEVIWPVKGIANVELRNRHTELRFGKQCQASVIFFRVSDYSRKFVAEWLKWCLWNNGELIDDSPSWIGNHPEFREHRHDQAILTTMAYREGIKLHWWGSVYNRFIGPEFLYEKLPCYSSDSYPPIFHHHRLRNSEFEAIRPSIEATVSV